MMKLKTFISIEKSYFNSLCISDILVYLGKYSITIVQVGIANVVVNNLPNYTMEV